VQSAEGKVEELTKIQQDQYNFRKSSAFEKEAPSCFGALTRREGCLCHGEESGPHVGSQFLWKLAISVFCACAGERGGSRL